MAKTRETETTCPLCDGTGWARIDDAPNAPVRRCDCFAEADVQRRLDAAGIPARYRDKTLENFFILPHMHGSIDEARLIAGKFVEKYPDVDSGLLFEGTAGVGKTHLAVAALQQILREKRPPVHGRFADFTSLAALPTAGRSSAESLPTLSAPSSRLRPTRWCSADSSRSRKPSTGGRDGHGSWAN